MVVPLQSAESLLCAAELLALAWILCLPILGEPHPVHLLQEQCFAVAEGHDAALEAEERALLEHHVLHVSEPLLLGPDDASRPADSAPTNEAPGREAVVLHRIEADERASAPEACLAVDCASAGLPARDVEEGGNNVRHWARAVGKAHGDVLEAGVREAVLLVGLAVQANHKADARLLEEWRVVFWSPHQWISIVFLAGGIWKCKHLPGQDP
mmetsp:Transcript_75995/g.168331  ORF Transcript_75995/g.168331 Transcript_75995/m.168331 type:complete len:212 (-) Transcript_75995:598-1233(-)